MRSPARVLVLLLVSLLPALPVGAAKKKRQPAPILSEEILTTLQSFYPVTSTEMGIHSYDFRMCDYSQKSVKQMISRLKEFETKLGRTKTSEMSVHDRINHRLLKSDVDVALLNLNKIQWHRKSPHLYVDEAINGIYFLLLSHHTSMEGKLPAILSRMREVPGLFATARSNIQKPPKIYVDAARESLESGLEFYRQVAADLMKQFPARSDEILRVSTAAREAMNEFMDWLSTVETGGERSYAIGKDNFTYLLAHEHFMSLSADSLLRLGESLLAEADKAYREYEAYVERNHQNGQDSVFVPKSFQRQDILDYYAWEVNQVKTFVKVNDLVTIADDIAKVEVIETPPYLRTMISGIAYQQAGPFDSVQVGYFYVRPIPDSLDREQLDARYRYVHRRGFRGSVVHEAYPGHHMQLQLSARNADPVRKWHRNICMAEGWALYCEELMYKAGLFGEENPAQWLGILGGIRFRAARIVADVRLHAGEWSYEECVDWMIRTLDADTESEEQYIRREVTRYTHAPTVQMSYVMGKREIQQLKEAAQQREGDNFSEQEFHDRLLAEGTIPPALMWEILNLQRPDGGVGALP